MTAQFHEWLLHEHGRLEPYPLVSPVALCCAAPAIQQSIDISYLLGPQQQTATRCCSVQMGQTDEHGIVS